MRKLLIAVIAAYILIPAFVAPILAQRQGDELGRVATCMCCLDIRLPDVHPGVAIGLLALIFIGLVVAGYIGDRTEKAKKKAEQEADEARKREYEKRLIEDQKRRAEEQERERLVQEEVTRLYGWWAKKRVYFEMNGVRREGVVVQQNREILKINYLSDHGELISTFKNVGEVKEVS